MRRGRKAAAAVAAAAAVGGAGLAAGAGGVAEPGTPTTGTTGTGPDPRLEQLEQELAASKRRERRMRRRAYRYKLATRKLRHAFRMQVGLGASGLERAFLCIHRFEGSWWDAGDPYWGGLQMDGSFMRAYGREFLRAFGPASNWTPAMQLAAAERAYLSGRGFGPWPNTRRSCGL